jgi:hypothetical protein
MRTSYTTATQVMAADGMPEVDANSNPILNSRTEQYGYDD